MSHGVAAREHLRWPFLFALAFKPEWFGMDLKRELAAEACDCPEVVGSYRACCWSVGAPCQAPRLLVKMPALRTEKESGVFIVL